MTSSVSGDVFLDVRRHWRSFHLRVSNLGMREFEGKLAYCVGYLRITI